MSYKKNREMKHFLNVFNLKNNLKFDFYINLKFYIKLVKIFKYIVICIKNDK